MAELGCPNLANLPNGQSSAISKQRSSGMTGKCCEVMRLSEEIFLDLSVFKQTQDKLLKNKGNALEII